MTNKLERGKCCENGINPKAVYEFINQAELRDLGIDSFMLIKNGKVVAEGYHPPYTNETPHVLFSMSKSITATALGFAIDEGLVSLDDSICKFFGEYDKKGKNAGITVRHLVTMTAGKLIGMATNRHHKDWVKIFFDAPAIAKPGKLFMYTNDNFYLISAIISKMSGETLVDYLYPRLFEPLGIKKPLWETDDFGYAAGGWGLYMPIEDTAKIMLCYSYGGKWEDKQILPAKWVEEATSFQVETLKKGQLDVTKGYGYGFWQTSMPNTYRAYGLHGQMGYVFKDKNAVLVINAGISKDELLSTAIRKMYETLWDEPEEEYEQPLYELLANLGDKDDLLATPRNTELEQKFNKKILYTRSSAFASMLHATMTTVLNEPTGHTDRFAISLDDENNLYLMWKEESYVNKIRLGMNNEYAHTPVNIGGLKLNAYAKASWFGKKLIVYARLVEGCHLRKLEFNFEDEERVRIKNDSYPDMPTLAAHYVDFSGIILPDAVEKILIKYIAPGVLLLGEPNFKSKKLKFPKIK
jgi:CubicO group peptidase (beta-lactamase class C family)